MVSSQKVLFGLLASLSFTAVDGFWRIGCGIIQSGRVDPIVNPGAISSHAHKISGPSNFDLSSTFETFQQARCTTCSVQKDKSAYWTPQLYYKHANGSFEEVPGSGMVIYYLGRGDKKNTTIPFPPGFRMLSGDNGARNNGTAFTYLNEKSVSERVSFACIGTGGSTPARNYMFKTDCPYGLRAQIKFQSCWDGVNLWKPDQSHVAYMSGIDGGKCPPSHPNLLPSLFYENLYGVNDIQKEDGGFFVFANGDATGYGFHGDFQNGWDVEVQAAAVKQCLYNDGGAGTIEECPPLQASVDPFRSWNCPERPPIVNEKVKGMLDKLPGCNPITGFQAAKAPSTNCPASLNVNPPDNYVPMFKPTPGTLYNGWNYMGCAKDAGASRALNGAKIGDAKMTIDVCQKYCSGKGYKVAGLEYGRECWCDQQLNTKNPLQSPSACAAQFEMICAGNTTQYCGAPNLIVLWNNTAVPNTPSSSSTVSTVRTSTTVSGVQTPSVPSVGTTTRTSSSGPTPSVDNTVTYVPNISTLSNGKGIYLGCYSEVAGRALSGAQFYNTTGMTNEQCGAYCAARNHAYFGTEFASECYCGSTINSPSVAKPISECTTPCKGNTNTKCGGPSRLTLWNNTEYIAPRNPEKPNNQFSYVGCFTEGKTSRALSAGPAGSGKAAFAKADDAMTVEMCASICFNKGYSWMGVEYGSECYCNQDGPINQAAAAPLGDKECRTLCKGNQFQYCGGQSRLNIYRKIGSGATNKVVDGRSLSGSAKFRRTVAA